MKSIFVIVTIVFFMFGTYNGFILAQTSVSMLGKGYVKLKNGKKYYGKVRLRSSINEFYVSYNDSIKFNISDIQLFKTPAGYFEVILEINNRNIMMREILIKQMIEGNMNIFTKYGTRYGNLRTNPKHIKYDYFSKEEGPIQEVSYKNLKLELSDNPESMLRLNEYNKFKKIKNGMLLAGAITTIYGVIRSVKLVTEFDESYGGKAYGREVTRPKFKFNYLIVVGINIMIGSNYLDSKSQDKLKDAIEVYNKN